MPLHHLSIDIETYSDIDIGKAGLYKYAQSPAFAVLLIAYSFDGGEVGLIDLTETKGQTPDWFLPALLDPNTIKHAYNAAFEWYCLSQNFNTELPLTQWRCTMMHGLYCGYTAGLEATGKALGLPQDKQKLAAGKALIKYFCVPCAPTKTNGGRRRNLPYHDPARWILFRDYCRQDVVTEMEIERRLSRFPVPDRVQAEWETDQRINSRGIAVDTELVEGALELDAGAREAYMEEARHITGLENPNSVAQLTGWLKSETDEDIQDLRKETISELLSKELPGESARRMLEIRQELRKISNKKYTAINTAVCSDNRVRGMLQFYGANRTGRWSGRIVQPQNLPRTYIEGPMLPLARELVKERNSNGLRLVFGDLQDTLSQLIRTAFVAAPGCILVDADFSAIEARVVAWLAKEEWVLDVFRTHGKIYEATASQLYGVPIDRIRKGNEEYALRQYGKAATLALGYAGGASALITAGHLPKDTPEETLNDIRDRWRGANPAIVDLWYKVEAAAIEAVNTGRRIAIPESHIAFAREMDTVHGLDFMTIELPSCRKLYYAKPHMGTNRFGRPALCYWGMNQKTRKWESVETFGGKLVENITQATARDCLAEAVERLESTGYHVVFHVHDEVVIEVPNGDKRDLDAVIDIMRQPPAWADGLPLNADGWIGTFFKKD